MSTKVVMEALSPTMEEGRLVEWKKQEGDAVAVGDVLAEVETDKAVMELVARAGGTLLKQVIPAGTTVPVSELVAVIGEPGEDVGDAGGAVEEAGAEGRQDRGAGNPARAGPEPAVLDACRTARGGGDRGQRPAAGAEAGRARLRPAAPQSGGRVKASPLARRMAAERGIDLASVSGSGPEGRVVARDLEGAAARAPAAPAAAGSGGTLARASRSPDSCRSALRGRSAHPDPQDHRAPAQSSPSGPSPRSTSPPRWTWSAPPRRGRRCWPAGGEKVSFNDIIIKATAMALKRHPECNAWWQDDHIRYWNEVHVSMAVAIEDGLITPVIRHTDLKSLREIAAESRDLAGRARERKLKPEEYTGGTFSVSNLGMLDIDEFTAVINPPETGILAVGRMVQQPVVHEGAVAIRRRMRLTMSCDHRVIDGATGARFLQTLKGMLENPLALVY